MATGASLASALQEGAAENSGQAFQLLVLEWKLALPARRDGDGPLLKEGQQGLAGIFEQHEVSLRGGRELAAQQEGMPTAQ